VDGGEFGGGETVYKTKEELKTMTPHEIAGYVTQLEETDPIAKENGREYVEWCMEELDEALEEMEEEKREEFYAAMGILPAWLDR
jgi:hypothetical protein